MTKSLDVLVDLMADEKEVEAWRDRADDLHATTTLSRRQAEVWALKELGYEHAEIAEIIGSSHSAVDNYSSDVRRKREVAERTVEALTVEDDGYVRRLRNSFKNRVLESLSRRVEADYTPDALREVGDDYVAEARLLFDDEEDLDEAVEFVEDAVEDAVEVAEGGEGEEVSA